MHRASLLLCLVWIAGCAGTPDRPALELTIATFNVWGAGANQGRPIDGTVAALRALDADVIALQEVRAEAPHCDTADCPPSGVSAAAALAAALGFFVYEQPASNDALWANAIISRYPIAARVAADFGVIIDVGGTAVAILNVHLTDFPYQPYQLLGIEYGGAPMLDSAAAAVAAAESARGAWVDRIIALATGLADDVSLVAICGDFNEPSRLDWTAAAARAGRHPLAVAYPASAKLAAAGFVDGYRANRPDELRHPGYTWTPLAAADDPDEHHDRIDFIYLKGNGIRVRRAAVAGEAADTSDIVVADWPSDHRAVVVTTELQKRPQK